MKTPLRLILLLPDGPRELPFVDGRIQILANAFHGAPSKRVTIDVVTPDVLEIHQGTMYVVDGEGGHRGRSRIGPGSIVTIGTAHAIVLPCGDRFTPPKCWKKLFVRLAQQQPALLFQLAGLEDPSLTRAVVEAAKHLSLADATLHAAKFSALIADGLHARDRRTPKDALAAATGKEALLDPNSAALVATEQRYLRESKQAEADARTARAAKIAPERDAGAAEPTVAWDILVTEADAGHGWFRGEPCIPPEQRPCSGDGLPLTHLCTVLVPREYRTQSPKLVALALFQAPNHGRRELIKLAHPHEQRFEDHIGGAFALVWLTADELRRGPQGAGHRWVALRARLDDPNAGKSTHDRGYRRPSVEIAATYARNHFGGTTDSHETRVQPRYLRVVERDVGGNFAGKDAHLELIRDRPRIVWSEG